MIVARPWIPVCAGCLWLGVRAAGAAEPPAARVLFGFEAGFDPTRIEARDARVELTPRDGGQVLRLTTGHAQDWPGITLAAPEGHWDLTPFAQIEIDVRNAGTGKVNVCCRVDNPGGDGAKNCLTEHLDLEAGKDGVLRVPLRRAPPAAVPKLFGMRGFPPGLGTTDGLDVANITQLIVFVAKPAEDHAFEIAKVRASGAYEPPPTVTMGDRLFPMIDRYGQYMHKDWPGKTHSDEELARRRTEEEQELAARPGPEAWDTYGGWAAGPQLAASGFFRVEKVNGRWWLVDPEGRLFWSHGIDCVHGHNGVTPVSDRQHWFAELPAPGSAPAGLYGKGSWAPHNYYEGKTYETFDFSAANLLRKYGEGWDGVFSAITHRRLRSWGMNTIANWSRREIYLQRKTPYTCTIHIGGRSIEGSEGYWGKFHDVFDPSFTASLTAGLASEKARSAGDPWCIGYFVDNELSWGDDVSLAVAALASPPDQPAKRAFLDDMKAKYGTIDKLNSAWETQHASWEALQESRTPPDRKKAGDDLGAFYTKVAETYFRSCRDAVKAVAPNNLYFGCRFAWVNDRAVRAAAPYCDVVSFNLYKRSVADHRLPTGLDKPVIVGEFHFGALDRGMFHTGLGPVADQAARAQAYKDYVTGALRNPLIVGTHWFQYGDQATTGRGDGENYQIGFLDICDTPYVETVEACRQVGYSLYQTRAGE